MAKEKTIMPILRELLVAVVCGDQETMVIFVYIPGKQVYAGKLISQQVLDNFVTNKSIDLRTIFNTAGGYYIGEVTQRGMEADYFPYDIPEALKPAPLIFYQETPSPWNDTFQNSLDVLASLARYGLPTTEAGQAVVTKAIEVVLKHHNYKWLRDTRKW
ncbi:MAG: hypothetical protein WC517_04520 [Patescibacteria group bacterium]